MLQGEGRDGEETLKELKSLVMEKMMMRRSTSCCRAEGEGRKGNG